MLSEKVLNKMADVLANRIDELQETIISEIAESISRVGRLTPTKAHQLVQSLRYGNSYNNIINKIRQVTNLNKNQILEIFEETAKENQEFARAFYEYRDIDFVPYEKNLILQREVRAMAKVSQETFTNLMRTSAFRTTKNGKEVFTPISRIYHETLDKALTSLELGQETADQVIRKSIVELTNSGIRAVDYESGRSMRLDSAVRMHVMDGMRTLSNELQEQFGEEFGADGIEVSHHINAAPDHIDTIDGKQFFKPLNKKEESQQYKVVDGKRYYNFNLMNEKLERPVSTMNCYHYTFNIILGVSPPQYTDKQLEKDKEKNKKGFEFEGKHYTMYEGTQLQRGIELKVRQLKEKKDALMELGTEDSLMQAGSVNRKIVQLRHKYNALCQASGLPPKRERMRIIRKVA